MDIFRADPAHLLHLFPAMRKNMFHELLDIEPWQSSFGSGLVDYRKGKSKSNRNRSGGRLSRKHSVATKWKNLKPSSKFSKRKIFNLKKFYNA